MSIVAADQGVLKVVESGDASVQRPTHGEAGYVAPPPPFDRLLGTTSWSLIDSKGLRYN
jgi:hypothetical protein